MLIVALMFATFFSDYLNFYELVNKCTTVRVVVLKDILKLEGHILACQRKREREMLVHVLRQMLFGQQQA